MNLAPRTIRRAGTVLLAGAATILTSTVTLLAGATPAAAHGGEAPDGSNYRIEVTRLTPPLSGLTVRTIEAGARLELVNRTGRTIEVLGYSGEPYLEIRPDGAYENTRSPATYLNRTAAGDTPVPADADPTQPPAWRRITTQPVVRWHDQRTYWPEAAPPAEVRADPDRQHRIRDWEVPLRDGTTPLAAHGTLDWLPPPAPLPWWAGIGLVALAVGTLGLHPSTTRGGTTATLALGTLAAVAGAGSLAYTVARHLDAGPIGFAELVGGLLTTQMSPLSTGAATLAVGTYVLIRRRAVDFAMTLAGTCLAIFAGVTNAAVFTRSVVPASWPAPLARTTVALVIAVGAGLALAGATRLRSARATAPAPAPAAAPPADTTPTVGSVA